MGVKKAIVEILAANASLVALVGKRLQPRENPQNADFPRITFHRLSTEYQYLCQGSGQCRTVVETFEIAAFSRSDLDAENVADEIIDSLPRNGTYGSISLDRVDVVNRSDVTEFPVYENHLPVPADVLTVEFQYEEDC